MAKTPKTKTPKKSSKKPLPKVAKKAAKKKAPRKVARDAGSGEFVSKATAKRRPKTTVVETV